MTTEERILQAVTAGNLRQRVTLMQPAMARDDYGNSKKVYSASDTVWAYIENHSSQVYETAGEVHIVKKSLVAIRYREGITPETRYMNDGRLYIPTGAPIDACGRHRALYVECVEELENGEEC